MDILLFNPPYVPTDLDEADEAQLDRGIAGAWAGGQHGMTVTDVLLDQVEVWLAITVVYDRSNDTSAGPLVSAWAVLSRCCQAERYPRNLSPNARTTWPPRRGMRYAMSCMDSDLNLFSQIDRTPTSSRTGTPLCTEVLPTGL